MEIVRITFETDHAKGINRSYTYYSEERLEKGQRVTLPTASGQRIGIVTDTDLPEIAINPNFKDKMKTIPAGSIIPAQQMELTPESAVKQAETIVKEAAKSSFTPYTGPGAELWDDKPPAKKPPESALNAKSDSVSDQVDGSIVKAIAINSDSKQVLSVIQQEAGDMVNQLLQMFPGKRIENEIQLTQAGEALANIRLALKRWDTARKALVDPLNSHVRWINGEFGKRMNPVTAEETRIKGLMSAFQEAETRRKAAEYQAAVKEAEKTPSPIPEAVAPLPPAPVKKMESVSANATVSFTTVWEWSPIPGQEAQIPREYLVLDTAKITRLVKAGLREIPGIRIFSSQVPTVRGR